MRPRQPRFASGQAMILVAVGANLPGPDGAGPIDNCERGLALMARSGIEIVARSRWYRSPAAPKSAQPDYVNGVVRVATRETPEGLLRRLHAIEARMGRVRGAANAAANAAPNAARVIDLDLLAFGATIRDGIGRDGTGRDGTGRDGAAEGGRPGLRLPHPRLHQRAFVLLPLREVAPLWTHPVTGLDIDRLVADLADDQGCVAVDESAAKTWKTI